MKKHLYIAILLLVVTSSFAQKVEFDGQLSGFANYSPKEDLELMLGTRYIPELSHGKYFDDGKAIDFEASANIWGNVRFSPFDTAKVDGNIQPYRVWLRFTDMNYEVRLGLQKIDFGSASLLRPLQWFNEIDPRDPLSQTNGVYGGLLRYYFKNNANFWLWSLYWNEKTRGLDAIQSYKKHPEVGARFQYPMQKGEIALSYHYRTANATHLGYDHRFKKIPENRIGIDGKWDVKIGLWFEIAYIHKAKNIGILTNQTQFNLGMDYTIGIGNGLGIMAEHLLVSYDEEPFHFYKNSNTTALQLSYPLAYYDNLSTIFTYNWEEKAPSFSLNYEHQFQKVSSYVILYYNPKTEQTLQENELHATYSGPGIRFMVVFNH